MSTRSDACVSQTRRRHLKSNGTHLPSNEIFIPASAVSTGSIAGYVYIPVAPR